MNLTDAERQALKSLAYDKFLETEFWNIVRTAVYERAHRRCELCFSPNRISAHHKTYEWHGFEDLHPETLICLCSGCHAKFHDKLGKKASSNGAKQSWVAPWDRPPLVIPGGDFGLYLKNYIAADPHHGSFDQAGVGLAAHKWVKVGPEARLDALLHVLDLVARGRKFNHMDRCCATPCAHLGSQKRRLFAAHLLRFFLALDTHVGPLQEVPKLFQTCIEQFKPLGFNQTDVTTGAQSLEGEFIERSHRTKFEFRIIR